jgi:hypothetical protein
MTEDKSFDTHCNIKSVCSQTLDAVNLLVLYLYANKDNTIINLIFDNNNPKII